MPIARNRAINSRVLFGIVFGDIEYFRSVFQRKPTTPPQPLVPQILRAKPFTSAATDWGKCNESIALEKYKQVQHDSGHHGVQSGFVISEKYPFLGVSPEAVVHDPTNANPFGLTEIKCPSHLLIKPHLKLQNQEIFAVNWSTSPLGYSA